MPSGCCVQMKSLSVKSHWIVVSTVLLIFISVSPGDSKFRPRTTGKASLQQKNNNLRSDIESVIIQFCVILICNRRFLWSEYLAPFAYQVNCSLNISLLRYAEQRFEIR